MENCVVSNGTLKNKNISKNFKFIHKSKTKWVCKFFDTPPFKRWSLILFPSSVSQLSTLLPMHWLWWNWWCVTPEATVYSPYHITSSLCSGGNELACHVNIQTACGETQKRKNWNVSPTISTDLSTMRQKKLPWEWILQPQESPGQHLHYSLIRDSEP